MTGAKTASLILAERIVYEKIPNWRGKSPRFMRVMVKRLGEVIAEHDAALVAEVREQCACVADNLVDAFDLPDGVSAAGARKARRISREIRTLSLPGVDCSRSSDER